MIPAPHAGAHAHAHSHSHRHSRSRNNNSKRNRNPMIGTAIRTAPATTKINSTTKNSAMICLAA